jgi:hypothetical protein
MVFLFLGLIKCVLSAIFPFILALVTPPWSGSEKYVQISWDNRYLFKKANLQYVSMVPIFALFWCVILYFGIFITESKPVLRIRDVLSRIQDPDPTIAPSRIRIPDPGDKKAPDPGSEIFFY